MTTLDLHSCSANDFAYTINRYGQRQTFVENYWLYYYSHMGTLHHYAEFYYKERAVFKTKPIIIV
jgi:hypothetical protein